MQKTHGFVGDEFGGVAFLPNTLAVTLPVEAAGEDVVVVVEEPAQVTVEMIEAAVMGKVPVSLKTCGRMRSSNGRPPSVTALIGRTIPRLIADRPVISAVRVGLQSG